MLFRRTSAIVLTGALAASLVCLAACRKEPAGSTNAEMKSAKPAEPAPHADAKPGEALSAEVEANLAKADAIDGKTDHVVSKCGMCALRMAGSDAHVTKLGDYELHFCSDDCKESFDENPTGAVLAFNVDE